MLKYQNAKTFLQKDILQISQKQFLWLMILMLKNYWKIVWKKLQKTNQTEFRIGKVIKRKGDKLYVKWKDYDNSFNSWIHKKDIV